MADLSRAELMPAIIDKLVSAATEAQGFAYCPYSNFPVGSAVLTEDGSIFKGCNVENGSYGLTICAERGAITAAVVAGHVRLKAIAIVTSAPGIARPCGACRQVIAEFSSQEKPTIVICKSAAEKLAIETISELLPHQFNLL